MLVGSMQAELAAAGGSRTSTLAWPPAAGPPSTGLPGGLSRDGKGEELVEGGEGEEGGRDSVAEGTAVGPMVLGQAHGQRWG